MKLNLVIILLFCCIAARAQQPLKHLHFKKLHGTILRSNNQPCTKCNVIIYGTVMGGSTDSSGRFMLNIPDDYEVMLNVYNLTTTAPAHYVFKVIPGVSSVVFILDKNALTLTAKYDAEWKKNEDANHQRIWDAFESDDFLRFVGQVGSRAGDPNVDIPVDNNNKSADPDKVYSFEKIKPKFKNGWADWTQYVTDNMKMPETAKTNRISGDVYVQVIVEKDGSLTDFKIAKSLPGGCDEEALRLVKDSPLWQPGALDDDTPVRCYQIIVVSFKNP